MKTSTVRRIVEIIITAIAVACALGNIIALNFGTGTPTKISESVWCFNLILWIGIYLLANHNAGFWKANYEYICNEYTKLLKISEDVNKISIEQNDICKEIRKSNEEILAGWGRALEENKKLIDERRDMLKALAEFDPQHPLVKASLKILGRDDSEKEASSTNPE